MEETNVDVEQEVKKTITDIVIRKVANGYMVIDVTPKKAPTDKEGEVSVALELSKALEIVETLM